MPSPPSPAMPPTPTSAIQLGLPRITSLLHSLQSPHLQTPIIHISGTNGKGSVSAYLSSILLKSGLRVGRFNSPHLVEEWDCLQLGGRNVRREVFEGTKEEVEEVDRREGVGATAFELLTATAFTVFARERPKLDLAVVEVGMGGLTDATNVVDPERTLLSMITPIELDHQKFLGETIGEIARVKAGIVKRGTEVVLAGQAHGEVEGVVRGVADEMDATVWLAGEGSVVEEKEAIAEAEDQTPLPPLVSLPLTPLSIYPSSTVPPPPRTTHLQARLPLPGAYQLSNSATALLASQLLRTSPRCLAMLPSLSGITDESMKEGIESTRWPGRLDWLALPSPRQRMKLLVDGAHNPSSAETLASYLTSLPPHIAPTTLVIGLSFPRDPASILAPLLSSSRISKVVCTPFTPPPSMPWIRATGAEEIASRAKEWDVEVEVVQSVEEAIEGLKMGERAVVAGSLYLAADIYRWVRGRGE
ncbi:Mur ligase [Leucosporidium creatinivorum]|uniref:Mur ligase n=1 Tax=Leucosporidium creatinivorum TaxID=106004 RepID=A0A1Y2EY72_9BASI|nr:Mur ligase [Leucosporidium creatinivorum]